MAFSRLPAPGTDIGPCLDDCTHKDCAATRTDADALCPYCNTPIGYNRNYAKEFDGERLAHYDCLWDYANKEHARAH